jgi:2-polyprenyl-3-methyl-5-hydroxy-6-metoxy-1,4-benzoquinol methylase
MALLNILKKLNYAQLGLSDYSLNYIAKMRPNLDYYFSIYRRCLDSILADIGRPSQTLTLVDYGGGHGFFSMFMKENGVGRVIYVDNNPKAVQTVQTISALTNLAPDIVIQGDARQLRSWCEDNSMMPDGLIGLDVIEHIYCLDDFFCDLYTISPTIAMLFSTGSNPYSMHLTNRLRRVMRDDELGNSKGKIGFLQQRRQYIAEHFTELDDSELDYWAAATRGLIYEDIQRAVDSQSPNLLRDPFNTCDPATGSWSERVLSIEEYRGIVQPYGCDVFVDNGFYDEDSRKVGRKMRHFLNRLLHNPAFTALAPFIILHIQHVQEHEESDATLSRRKRRKLRRSQQKASQI